MANALSLNLLGPLEVLVEDTAVRLPSQRERAVIAVLGLRRGQTVTTEEIIDAVWGQDPPRTVRNQLSICVSALRKALSAPKDSAIATVPQGYSLTTAFVETDLDRARELSEAAHSARDRDDLPEAIRLLRSASALWRGRTLMDVTSERIRGEAEGIDQWRASLQEERLEMEVGLGRYEGALRDLQTLVSEHPFRERSRALLMRALHGVGRQGDAMNTYAEGCALLSEELGVDPGAELQRAHLLILDNRTAPEPAPSLAGSAAPPARPRLRADPVPRVAATGPAAPDQLPPPPVGFRGRDEELALLEALYTAHEAERVAATVAVTGMGGVGKTAFSLHWADQHADRFPDGRLYADMSGFAEGASPLRVEDVLYDFLHALGTPHEEIPCGAADRATKLRSQLSGKRVLVILDNAHSTAQVRPLLTSEPLCTTLITSRNVLEGLAVTHRVSHVPLAPLDGARSVEVLRAALREPPEDPAPLFELARLCDGLPLALRITAARLTMARGQTLHGLIRRLDSEQRRLSELSRGEIKLTATFALSYRTLSPEAARLFHHLGQIRAPEVPEWVMAALLDSTFPDTTQAALNELVDGHLVELVCEDPLGQPRYRMYDLLRLYARDQSRRAETEEGLRSAVQRYLGGWLHLLREADLRTRGGIDIELRGSAPLWQPGSAEIEQCMASPTLWRNIERHTLSRAVEQAAVEGLDEFAWELAVSAMPRFLYDGQIKDWYQTHQHALSSVRAAGNLRGEAALLFSLGNARAESGESADELYQQALRIFTKLGDDRGRGLVLLRSADQARARGDLHRALQECLLARDPIEHAADPIARLWRLLSLARTRIRLGDLALARDDLAEAHEAFAEDPRWPVRAHILRVRGELREATGDREDALNAFGEALGLARSGSDPLSQTHLLLDLARVHLDGGDTHTSHELTASALELALRLHNSYWAAAASRLMARIHRARGSDDRAAAFQRQATEHSARLMTDAVR